MAARFEELGIKVHVGKYASLYNPLNIFLIRKYILRYDVIHVHLFPSQYYVAVAQWLVCKPVVAVTTEHGMMNTRRKFTFFRPIEKLVYRQFKVITGVSVVASEALAKWLGGKRVVTVNNGLDIRRFISEEVDSGKTRRLLDIPDDAKVLIMVARFYEAKDHDCLIRAMALLPESVHLILVGSGPTLMQCVQLARELKVQARIHFTGYTEHVAQYIKASDIGILASHHEAFGLSLIEYMACGLPVIASDVPGIREVVAEAALLFPPSDSEDLVRQIQLLISNPVFYHQLQQKGAECARRYDIRSVAQQYITIYNQVLCSRN